MELQDNLARRRSELIARCAEQRKSLHLQSERWKQTLSVEEITHNALAQVGGRHQAAPHRFHAACGDRRRRHPAHGDADRAADPAPRVAGAPSGTCADVGNRIVRKSKRRARHPALRGVSLCGLLQLLK
jgi:hypothetical protein